MTEVNVVLVGPHGMRLSLVHGWLDPGIRQHVLYTTINAIGSWALYSDLEGLLGIHTNINAKICSTVYMGFPITN